MLHATPKEHNDNPPSTWIVAKAADRCWQLRDANGGVLERRPTKKAAEELKITGHLVDLYNKEGRWFAGEQVDNWKPYVNEALRLMDGLLRRLIALNATQRRWMALKTDAPEAEKQSVFKAMKDYPQNYIGIDETTGLATAFYKGQPLNAPMSLRLCWTRFGDQVDKQITFKGEWVLLQPLLRERIVHTER